jgi:hypothetical protein
MTTPPPNGIDPNVPSDPLVMAANAGLAEEEFRKSVRKMHEENYPLVKMVDALGLEDDLTAPIRKILENLPEDVVKKIREATLEMLDSGVYAMPLNCTVTDAELNRGDPVDVKVEPMGGRETIHVRPK